MTEMWNIKEERRQPHPGYYCLAFAYDGGEEFRLECTWEQCMYILSVYGQSDGELLSKCLFADADCGKYVRQIMRIARRDVKLRLARLDRLHRDGFLCVHHCKLYPSQQA